MTFTLTSRSAQLLQADEAAAATPLRVVIRVLLGLFVAVLLAYIVIEQIGSWRRRRNGRE